jgi:hypothetical protein
LLAAALGSMAISWRRRDANRATMPAAPASESTDEGGRPNGTTVPAEPAHESSDGASHPTGTAVPVEPTNESDDESGHLGGAPGPVAPSGEPLDAESIGPPGRRRAQLVLVVGGFTMQVLEGCGRSPGFLLVGLGVRDADSGERIGLRQATARTLLERGPQLVWSEAVRWQGGRADAARRARVAEGGRQIEAEYADADPAERQRALTAFYKQNTPRFPWRVPLQLGPTAVLWLLRRRLKAVFPETVAVQEHPGPKGHGAKQRPGRGRRDSKQRVGPSAGQTRAVRIGVRAVRTMGIRRSIRALRQARRAQRHARRAERAVKAGARGAKKAAAS